MPLSVDLTFDDVNRLLAYDPYTGKFTWKVAPSRGVRPGAEAGTFKSARSRNSGLPQKKYLYIHVMHNQTPGARVAWLLYYGEWPTSNVLFRDGDTTNLRIDNLRVPAFPTIKEMKAGRKVYKMDPREARIRGLKRYYGMTGEEYGAMLADQKGVCAICEQPETAMFNGRPKVMHVDHDHATGQIRALLCGSCNGMLGLAKDKPETLRAAAIYLEKHSAKIVSIGKEGSA